MSTDNKYQFKGTPGPLHIHRVFDTPVQDSLNGEEHLEHWIMNSSNCILATSRYSKTNEVYGYPVVSDLYEMEANAHLIAAAPDLLEFAVMMLQSIDGGGRVVTFQDHHIDELRAAIHKALNIEAEEA